MKGEWVLQYFVLILLTVLSSDSSGVSVTVNVDGFSSSNGFIRLAVFDSSDHWPEDKDNAVLALTAPISGDVVIIDVSTLEPGEYAMAAFHDEDGDAVFDRGLFGVPTEKYGFSNNARSRTGPPDFEDAVVVLSGLPQILRITLR